MTDVQEHDQLPRQEEQRDLLEGEDDVSSEPMMPSPVGRINPDQKPEQLTIKTKVNPVLASSFKRKSENASSIHPAPSGPEHGRIQLDKSEKQRLVSATTNEIRGLGDDSVKTQLSSLLSLALLPAMLTLYRVYFANSGPTWLSFHPMMMVVSVLSMLSAMLCQRLGGEQNITLVGSLSFASALSLFVSIYAVWSAKEMYGKPHFLSMHSHFGGMTIFGILSYALAAYWVFNPVRGIPRKNEKWQKRLVTWGKVTAAFALTTMSVGIFEIERSWIFLLFWVGSLLLMVPFLLLDWYK